MANITYRANLSAAVFPMTLADAGRTVIIPQADQNFDRRVDPVGEQKTAGIPQAIFMENVFPTVSGYQSIGRSARVSLPTGIAPSGTVTAIECFVVPDIAAGDVVVVARNGTLAGYVDVISNNVRAELGWQYAAGSIPSGTLHSTATVRGTHYWCDGTNLFSYTIDATTKQLTFTNITGSVTGVTVADIKYIVGSYNYLILLMDSGTIAWSSTTTPTDFTVSLITGAGSETPSGAQGANFLREHPDGFYVYCNNSIIFAKYTANARYPWRFVPVADAGGYNTPNQVFGNYTTGLHYGIDNSNKVQLIEGNKATLVASEVSTFLERKKHKDVFNYTANEFSKINGFVYKSISFILDRYVIVSIGFGTPGIYSHAFVYDVLLQRYGMLKLNHSFIVANFQDVTLIPNSISVQVQALSIDVYDTTAVFDSVLMLGKFQLIRDNSLTLLEVVIECGRDAALGVQDISILDFPSMDGKSFDSPIALNLTTSDELLVAPCRITALNHSIMLKGAFDVNTLQLKLLKAGKR